MRELAGEVVVLRSGDATAAGMGATFARINPLVRRGEK